MSAMATLIVILTIVLGAVLASALLTVRELRGDDPTRSAHYCPPRSHLGDARP